MPQVLKAHFRLANQKPSLHQYDTYLKYHRHHLYITEIKHSTECNKIILCGKDLQ